MSIGMRALWYQPVEKYNNIKDDSSELSSKNFQKEVEIWTSFWDLEKIKVTIE